MVELFVKSLNGEAVKVDLGQNSDIYLARVNWSADGKALYVQRLSRNQQRLDLLKADPLTGASSVLLSETSDSWIDLNNDFKPLKDGLFIWVSETDGNNHIYLYGADGKLIHQVTKGDWPVDHIAAVNEATGDLWFEASKDTPIENRLYKVSYRTPRAPVAVTSAGGWWSTSVSDGGRAFIGTYSDPQTPAQTGLYSAGGQLIRWIEENPLDESHPYFAYKDAYSAPEFGTLSAVDGQAMQWSMLKPKGFDAAKKYPVIVNIYGGPASQFVKKPGSIRRIACFRKRVILSFHWTTAGHPIGQWRLNGRSISSLAGLISMIRLWRPTG